MRISDWSSDVCSSDLDMIAIHVRRAVETVVDDAVVQPDLVAADRRLDAADQVQVLAEHRRLLDDALAPPGAFVAVPALAIAGPPRRDRPDPPVERGRNFFARAVDIMAGIVVIQRSE